MEDEGFDPSWYCRVKREVGHSEGDIADAVECLGRR